MESALTISENYFYNMKQFPTLTNGRIDITQFLDAATDLVKLLERLGKFFAPVTYDMQGNINKIKREYAGKESNCLLELMDQETRLGNTTGAHGVLWLNRALLFFEIVFHEIEECLKRNDCDTSMTKIFTLAYEGSVKQYHNWITQQIFFLICKLTPNLSQILKSFQVDSDLEGFKTRLASFNLNLHTVRFKIDDFFKERNVPN